MKIEWLLIAGLGVGLVIAFRDKLGLEDLFCKLGMSRKSGLPCVPQPESVAAPPPAGTQWPSAPLRPAPASTPGSVPTAPAPSGEIYGPPAPQQGPAFWVPWAASPPPNTPDFPGEWAQADERGYLRFNVPFTAPAPRTFRATFNIYVPMRGGVVVGNVYQSDRIDAIRAAVQMSPNDMNTRALDLLRGAAEASPATQGPVGSMNLGAEGPWSMLMGVVPILFELEEPAYLMEYFGRIVYQIWALEGKAVYETLLNMWLDAIWGNYSTEQPQLTHSSLESLPMWRARRSASMAQGGA